MTRSLLEDLPRPAALASHARVPGRRRVALLAGTTTLGDCQVALRALAQPDRLVQGPSIAAYERAFAARIGTRYASSFAAARVGFYGLLRALGVGPGDEVLLPAPTHIVVANAVRYVGARPVYVDCTLDTYNMDLDQAEQRITPRTKVLLVQHTFGIPNNMDEALSLARRHGLELVEDCVHALGATYAGRPVGSFGRAAFFSTEETKIISSTMGGMVVTDDDRLAAQMAAFQAACAWPTTVQTAAYVLKLVLYYVLLEPRLHRYTRAVYEKLGRRSPLPRPTVDAELAGQRPPRYEQRLSNAQAELALRQLRRLDANLAHRRWVARVCQTHLDPYGFEAPRPPAGAAPAWVRYPLRVADREAAIRATEPYVVLGTWFTSVLEEAVSPAHGGYQDGSCPRAERAARHLVNIPTHSRVLAADVAAITAALAGVGPDRD